MAVEKDITALIKVVTYIIEDETTSIKELTSLIKEATTVKGDDTTRIRDVPMVIFSHFLQNVIPSIS